MIIFPTILIAAVVGSLVRSRPATVGEEFLTAIDRAHSRAREGVLLIDYTPDAGAVEAASREVTERGDGAVDDYGIELPADHHWVKTADAVFSWHPMALPLRKGIEEVAPQLTAALAHGPLDDAESDRAIASALGGLGGLTDEALFLAWANADRGMLAEAKARTRAAREALLLMLPGNAGPILVIAGNGHHVYVVPQEGTNAEAWCELECFDEGGRLAWGGNLRVTGSPAAERVRTLAAMMAGRALAPATQPAGVRDF